ncbi:hypothetical protein [Peredibacter starrii]|uniref:Uncharacterized protein n=1 Tax=Peredibacter starrii TaxID=28202 RepID=A0AAX4HN90_9BACT|nr:hypothetical protein [Peredibacter starrii]WPU64731.1 hypothetical protein SOO65_18725 [Peredibacter starrii]
MDYIQTYFECFKATGTDTTLEINRMRGSELIEAIKFDHVNHDGVSIMTELARRYPAEGFQAPTLLVKPKPSMSKRLIELAKWYIRHYPFMPPTWKVASKGRTQNANGKVLIDNFKASDQTFSTNTKLLFALDLTSREYISNPKPDRVWMTPVGMYTTISRETPPKNRVSFIDIEIGNNSTLSDVQSASREQLKNLSYWGTILTMALPQILGKFLFKYVAKYTHLVFRRTGTLTNLGEWTIPGVGADEWWTFGQLSVAKMAPVAGTAIMVNGKLGLSVHFHPIVGFSDAEAQNFAEKWKANFLKL